MAQEKTYRVVCTLRHKPGEILGARFVAGLLGEWVAEKVTAEQARYFASIPGGAYKVDPPLDAPEPLKEAAPTKPKVRPIKMMGAHELETLLSEHPSAHPAVADAESQRKKPRPSVLAAIEKAKATMTVALV